MNKIYDKLLLAVAVLALLGGVGFYVMKSGELPSATPQVGQPGDNPYQAIPVPTSAEVAATWPEAHHGERMVWGNVLLFVSATDGVPGRM